MKRCLSMGVVALLLAGCAAGGMKDVNTTGFLGDYSQLKPGDGDLAALGYIKPGADFKKYDAVMFDRITVWLSPEAKTRGVDPAILKEMTDYYQSALINAVKDGYQVVDQPGPNVLRVRAAITDIKPSNPVSNTLSTVLPIGAGVAVLAKAATNENIGTGEAATEVEFLDAQSGERVAAIVDRRQGGKMAFRGSWTDTKDAFDHWAQRFRARLDELRGVK